MYTKGRIIFAQDFDKSVMLVEGEQLALFISCLFKALLWDGLEGSITFPEQKFEYPYSFTFFYKRVSYAIFFGQFDYRISFYSFNNAGLQVPSGEWSVGQFRAAISDILKILKIKEDQREKILEKIY